MLRPPVAMLVMAAIVACLAGCGDDHHTHHPPRPTPTPGVSDRPLHADGLQGVYDATLTDDLAAPPDVVGQALPTDFGEGLRLIVRTERYTVDVSGQLLSDGSIDLVGQVQLPHFRFVDVHGLAAATRNGEARRIVGTLASSSSFVGLHATFTFARAGDRSAGFSGTYRFAFSRSPSGCDCDSSATFRIAVQPAGFGGDENPTSDVAADGTTLGTILSGDCPVTESGRVACSMAYTLPRPTPAPDTDSHFYGVLLTGHLDSGGAATEGRLLTSFNEGPPIAGTWTATRVGP